MGKDSTSEISGGSFKADAVYVTQKSQVDGHDIVDPTNTSGGHLTFKDGVQADEIGAVYVTGTDSQLSISGSGTSVTAGRLTVKPEEGTKGGKVSVTGGTLKVTGDAALTNSTLEAAGGNTQFAGMTASGSTITVSGGAVNAGGTVNMTNSNMSITGGSVTFNNWTATGGKTTIGNSASGVASLAEGDAMTVTGTTTLDNHDIEIASGESVEYEAIDAKNGSDVTTNGSLTVTNEASFTDGTLTSSGTTTLGSLSSTGSGKVNVTDGTFTVKGATNTNEFYVSGGTVTLNADKLANGGTMTGTNDTGRSALYVTGGTVNATNVTFKGGEVAVDGGELHLTGGVVDVPDGWFTTEGGTITTNGTTINSGVWSNESSTGPFKKGSVTLTNSTVNGSAIGAQNDSAVTMIGGKAEDVTVWVENGGTVTFRDKAEVTADEIKAMGNGRNTISITGGAQVTADSLNADNSNITITGSSDEADSHLIVNGDATLSGTSKLTVSNLANATFKGDVTFNGGATMELTGANAIMTFAEGSNLYVDTTNGTNPAVSVTSGANLKFAAGSSTYTTASEDGDGTFTAATVAATDEDSTITVDNGAALYVKNANIKEGSEIDLSKLINQSGTMTSWASKETIYGNNILQKINVSEDGTTGTATASSLQDTVSGILPAAAVFDAARLDDGSAAAGFVNGVLNEGNLSDAEQEKARIASALNAEAGMTGLAGVAQGTYRFTTAFTDLVANHEEGTLWASYLHDKSSVDGLSVGGLRADYDLTFDGVVVGSDFYNNGRTTVGAAFAYADGDISTKSGVSTSNDVDYYGGMIYGAVKGGAGMTYRAKIGYNKSSNDLTQWNTGTRITGSVDADAFHVGVSAEKEIRTGAGVWTPFLGLQYVDLSVDDYSDSLGFRHDGGSAGLWNMPLGVSYKLETTHGAWTYAPVVTLGYRFVFGDDSIDERFSYNGVGSTFGTDVGEDSFFTRVGFEAKKDNLGFGVHYGYERGSNTEANQWGIDCSFYF